MPEALPTFVIGGAPRAGTTYLCHALDAHPQITLAKPFIPEPKVFMTPAPGPAGYRARYRRFFDGDVAPARGEKTSYYLESADACTAIRATLPEVRLVFLVREPVDRAYSNYLWSRKNGLETLGFEEAVEREGSRADPLPPEQAYARPFDYLSRGRYAHHARRYLEAFGAQRVTFHLYEDLVVDRAEPVLQAIHAVVGVEPRPLDGRPRGLINAARESGPPLAAPVRDRLRERMRGEVEAFAALTGLDVGRWGY